MRAIRTWYIRYLILHIIFVAAAVLAEYLVLKIQSLSYCRIIPLEQYIWNASHSTTCCYFMNRTIYVQYTVVYNTVLCLNFLIISKLFIQLLCILQKCRSYLIHSVQCDCTVSYRTQVEVYMGQYCNSYLKRSVVLYMVQLAFCRTATNSFNVQLILQYYSTLTVVSTVLAPCTVHSLPLYSQYTWKGTAILNRCWLLLYY
jgi:hypothetical protein